MKALEQKINYRQRRGQIQHYTHIYPLVNKFR